MSAKQEYNEYKRAQKLNKYGVNYSLYQPNDAAKHIARLIMNREKPKNDIFEKLAKYVQKTYIALDIYDKIVFDIKKKYNIFIYVGYLF